jgi:rod shape-determining protein MreD
MERNVVWLILFALFVVEGAVLPVFLPVLNGTQLHIDFVLTGVLLIGLLYHRHSALLYGVCFGFMHDLMYGQMIGVFAFTMGMTGYLINLVFADKYQTMFRDLLVLVVGFIMFHGVVSLFYFVFGLYQPHFSWNYVFVDLLLRFALNLLFAAIIYIPTKKHYQKMQVRYGSYFA